MRKGNLFVISGPSGAGKGTLVAHLLRHRPDVWVSVSATTRKPRPQEVDGVHYFFVSDEEFDTLINEDGLLEWACVHQARYGTPKKVVEDHIEAGKQVVLEIDVQGALQVKQKMPAAHLVFIEPPSFDILERRLRGRGTESDEVIEQRMKTAHMELSRKKEYDVALINDDLETATQELLAYIDDCAQ